MIRCSATVGYTPGSYGLERIRCQATTGVRSRLDYFGDVRGACPAEGHEREVRQRFGRIEDAARDVEAEDFENAKAGDYPLAGGPAHESPSYRSDMRDAGRGAMLR